MIIPTSGRPDMLYDAVRSVLAQTYHHIEVIVVDDAGDPPADLSSIRDGRLSVVRIPTPMGPGHARNVGVGASSGQVLAFLDDDDQWTRDRLAHAMPGLDRASIVVCGSQPLGSRGWTSPNLSGDVHDRILNDITPHLGQTLIRREAFQPFDETYLACQDLEWWLRVTQRSELCSVEAPGFLWRRHSGTRGLNSTSRRIEFSLKLMHDYRSYFREHPKAQAFRLRRLAVMSAGVGRRRSAARFMIQAYAARARTLLRSNGRHPSEFRVAMLNWPSQNPYVANWVRAAESKGVHTEPYSTRHLRERSAVQVLHIHWPEKFLARRNSLMAWRGLGELFLTTMILRARGVALVWTAHNLKSHEGRHPLIERTFWAYWRRAVDGAVALTQDSANTIRQEMTRAFVGVVAHGAYAAPEISPAQIASERLRADGTGDTVVLGLLGRLRGYKRADLLIRAVKESPMLDVRLIVAGEAAGTLGTILPQLGDGDRRIHVWVGPMTESDFAARLQACDVVVLPYSEYANSGVMLYSLSCGRPVAIGRGPAAEEIQAQVGEEWVRLIDGEPDAALVAELVCWARAPRSEKPDLSFADWERLSDHVLGVYTESVRVRRQRTRGVVGGFRS